MILGHKIVHINTVLNFIKTRSLAVLEDILYCYFSGLFSIKRVLRTTSTLEGLNESAFFMLIRSDRFSLFDKTVIDFT